MTTKIRLLARYGKQFVVTLNEAVAILRNPRSMTTVTERLARDIDNAIHALQRVDGVGCVEMDFLDGTGRKRRKYLYTPGFYCEGDTWKELVLQFIAEAEGLGYKFDEVRP